jgi:hypothetical protein
MQALLELNCMPAGMELFPAANEEQWTWIKRVIEESDYYIVIVGGRCGSVSKKTGQSYTEMEYRYALELGRPTIALLHEDPSKLESGRTEQSRQGRKRLERFRALLEERLCKYWTTPSDLGGKVSRSLTQLMKSHPAVGWVRADQVPVDSTREVFELKRQILDLHAQLRAAGEEDSGNLPLAQGTDSFELDFTYSTQSPKTNKAGNRYWVSGTRRESKIVTTWDELFKYLAPELLSPQEQYKIVHVFNQLIEREATSRLEREHEGDRVGDLRIYSEPFEVIKIQLMALGLIEFDDRGRWQLTERGHNYMVRLIAVHRKAAAIRPPHSVRPNPLLRPTKDRRLSQVVCS